MTGLTFQQLVKAFSDGMAEGVSGGNGNLKIKNDQLIHYNTVIAERHKEKVLVNVSRYSVQTSLVQRYLHNTIPSEKIIEVHMVPKNYSDSMIKLLRVNKNKRE